MMGSSTPKCTLSSEYVYCGTVGGGDGSTWRVWRATASQPAVCCSSYTSQQQVKDFQRIQIQQKSKADISQEDIERIFFLMPFD